MLIEFDKIEPQIIPHMRGGEKEVQARMYTDPQNKIMRGRLIPGASIGMHTHETSSEQDRASGRPLGHASQRVYHARMYAVGTRRTMVVIMEIHIGVTVSPAPRMMPPSTWETATAMYPAAMMLIIR